MDSKDRKFNVTIPASIQKGDDGEWRVFGLASTPNRDQQGEVVDLKGLDLSPIEKGRGIFNFDHKKGPENTIGVIDTYKKDNEGLYLGGYLFKEHDRAKAIQQIMTSFSKSDRGRMGMSVEGIIKQRNGKDGKTISKAVIHSCALTMNPVNTDTYASLIKSLSGAEVEFEGDSLGTDLIPEEVEGSNRNDGKLTFTPEQVVDLVQKALSVGNGYATSTPGERSGGDALAQEDLDKEPKKVMDNMEKACGKCGELGKACKCLKSLKKGDSEFFKSQMNEVLTKLHDLYPGVSKSTLWEIFKERLNRKFEGLGLE